MHITATLKNSRDLNEVTVATEGSGKSIAIPSKPGGYGSAVNGGELLFLALATCYCNDVYREAAKRSLPIEAVEVTVSGQFGGEGEPAAGITYEVALRAPSLSEEEVAAFLRHVDSVAEIHNTLRKGVPVTLKS